MLQANQNQALLPSEKPRPSPSKPPLRRYAAFTPKAGERLPAVSAEQMEISRLRTELSRVKMERDILKNPRGSQFRLRAEKRLALPWMVEGSGRRLFGGV
jgi:transposase-like protein